MDLGLGHLTQLKQHLLNEALRSGTTYDAAIAALGRGVAARFEGHCGRRFARVVGETYETTAERDHLIVPRYPLEAVTKVELRETMTAGWVDQGTVNDLVENIFAAAGLVQLAAPLGGWRDRLRLTYTGGFWYPTTAARAILSGSVTIAEGALSAFVTFSTAFATRPAVGVAASLADGATLIDVTAQAVSRTGFTVALAAAAPAGGLTVAWLAAEAADDLDPAVIQSGTATLAAADESAAVAFGTAFAAAPRVFCTVVPPTGGTLFAAQPADIDEAGFTALLGAPVPDTGYTLAWFAVAAGATSAAPTLPTGATALPADLTLAWLTQCALAWNSLDVLGLGLSDAKARESTAGALAKLDLAPEVLALLAPYRRYAIT